MSNSKKNIRRDITMDNLCQEIFLKESALTKDEEADLIIKKLKGPPKPPALDKYVEQKFAELLSTLMAEEVDREILNKLKGT